MCTGPYSAQGKERVQPTIRSIAYGHSVSTYDTASLSIADGELLQTRAALEWFKMRTPFPHDATAEEIERQTLARFLMETNLDTMRRTRAKQNASGTWFM